MARRSPAKRWRFGTCTASTSWKSTGKRRPRAALSTGQRGPFPAPGDVGTPPAGWSVRLSEDREVLVHSADLFEGYWRNAEATRAVKGEDGWLRTGDIGEWTDGALRLVDRARDFIVTSGGKTLSPSFIENALRAVSLHCGSRRLRSWPQISLGARRDRLRYGRRLGARQ